MPDCRYAWGKFLAISCASPAGRRAPLWCWILPPVICSLGSATPFHLPNASKHPSDPARSPPIRFSIAPDTAFIRPVPRSSWLPPCRPCEKIRSLRTPAMRVSASLTAAWGIICAEPPARFGTTFWIPPPTERWIWNGQPSFPATPISLSLGPTMLVLSLYSTWQACWASLWPYPTHPNNFANLCRKLPMVKDRSSHLRYRWQPSLQPSPTAELCHRRDGSWLTRIPQQPSRRWL